MSIEEQVELTTKIQEFAKLEPGWNSYKAEAFSEECLDIAKRLVRVLPDPKPGEKWEVLPDCDGPVIFQTATLYIEVWASRLPPPIQLCRVTKTD